MNEVLDVLNREKQIEQLEQILLSLSENKKGCVFALDGGWGYGKTYILEKFEKEVELIQNEETKDDRYYVFHYNCWQYDYYEEPAIAIISAMLEKIELENQAENVVKDTWKTAKDIMMGVAGDFVKNKIGIDLVHIYSGIKENGKERVKNTYEFDKLFAFKKTVDSTRNRIKELASKKTVVLVVDELDRCMPNYAIKVLERLHHMFDGLENVIVIMAIDSAQLEHSVREIYGNSVDTDRYLRKFISFSLKLNLGEVQDLFIQKYSDYFNKFEDADEVIPQLMEMMRLCKVDIRNLEKLMDRISLIHNLVCKEKCSASVLLFEMMWGLMKQRAYQSYFKDKKYFRYFNSLHWIPEIDLVSFSELNECIGKEIVDHLKKLKDMAKKGIIVIMNEGQLCRVQQNANGYAWYLLDAICAKRKTFYIEKESECEAMIRICKQFDELGKVMW